MSELQVIRFLADLVLSRIAESRLSPDRGDVAEKIVIVGIFVVLAIAVGALITKAVTGDANHIAKQISNAP